MTININVINEKKELRYVVVYNKLFKMINEKNFPEGSRLPSEPELARELGVSRSTLRQALSLLKDDGLIKNVRGKGNFITEKKAKKKIGLEKHSNIIYKSLDIVIDSVEIDFRIVPPSDYYLKVLEHDTAATVCVDRWYKSSNEYIAYTFTILPIDVVSKFNINLNNKEELLKFLEDDIYSVSTKSDIEIKFSTSGKFTTKNHPIISDNSFYLIEEGILDIGSKKLVFNKNYIPLSHGVIKINSLK